MGTVSLERGEWRESRLERGDTGEMLTPVLMCFKNSGFVVSRLAVK